MMTVTKNSKGDTTDTAFQENKRLRSSSRENSKTVIM